MGYRIGVDVGGTFTDLVLAGRHGRLVLDKLAPPGDYRHHLTGEDNADAHLKRTLIHHQVILPVTKGKLDLGPWEQVFYAEFDGRRKKRVVVKIHGE